MSYHDLGGDLDGFIGQTQANAGGRCGTARTRPYAHVIRSGHIRRWGFAQTVSDMLDRPRTSTLPLRDQQHGTAWAAWRRSSGCLALPDLRRGLGSYKVRGTESHEHERRRECEHCFGKTRDGGRIDDTEHDRLQIFKEETKGTGTVVRTGFRE